MDKLEKDMPNKKNPEKGKPEIDIHQSDKDKVPKLYSNPNDLKNLLQDLDDYESWGADSNNYNSSTQDRITPEPPDEKPAAKKITKAYKYQGENGEWIDSNTSAKPGQALPLAMERGNGSATFSGGGPNMGFDSIAPENFSGPTKSPLKPTPVPVPVPKVNKMAAGAVPGHKQVYDSSRGTWSQPTAPKPATAAPGQVANQPAANQTPEMPKMPTLPKAPEPQLGDSKEPGPNHIEQLKHENVGGAIDALSKVLKSVEPPQPQNAPGQPQTSQPSQSNVTQMRQQHQAPQGHASHPPMAMAATLKNIIIKIAKDKHPDKETTGVVESTHDFMQDDSALEAKEVDDLLEDTNAYMEYLGLSDADEKPKGSRKK